MAHFVFYDSPARAKAEELRLRWQVNANRMMLAFYRFDALLRKNFNPNQPRVPSGSPDGGQWTDGSGGAAGGSVDDGAKPFHDETPPESDTGFRRIAYTPPPNEPPHVPSEPPNSGKERASIVKSTVRFLVRAATSRTPVGQAIWSMIDAAEWAKPYVQSYLDPPKNLEDLQRAASDPKTGYDVHHLVERTSARNAGFPASQIDGPGNTVRIPKLKHWELNSWFERESEEYGGLSPRQYLRNPKIDWDERVRIGKAGLIEVGVLKP